MNSPLPEVRSVRGSVRTFLRRLIWRKEMGPLSAEGGVEIRDLTDDSEASADLGENAPAHGDVPDHR